MPPPAGSPPAGAVASGLRPRLERLTCLALGYGPDLPAGSFVFILAASLIYLLGVCGGRLSLRRLGLS